MTLSGLIKQLQDALLQKYSDVKVRALGCPEIEDPEQMCDDLNMYVL